MFVKSWSFTFNVQEVRRLENIKNLEAMQKIQLPRSSAHTAAPGQWMTQNGGYYPMMAGEHSAAAAMHHQAALRANPMHQQHLGEHWVTDLHVVSLTILLDD